MHGLAGLEQHLTDAVSFVQDGNMPEASKAIYFIIGRLAEISKSVDGHSGGDE